jgi:carbamoyl-phosphate synthase small subunit
MNSQIQLSSSPTHQPGRSLESLLARGREAALVLADGTIFHGYAIGAPGFSTGEVVFNTALTGYQEILTDPSYCGQMVTLTYPHIGSYAINSEDMESRKVFAAGLIIKDLPIRASNFRGDLTLDAYLKREGVVGIAGLDTRKLTRLLREKGAQNGCIIAAADNQPVDIAVALQKAQAAPQMAGLDLAKVVTTNKPYEWVAGTWRLGTGDAKPGFSSPKTDKFHVVAFDFGVKQNILRLLADRGCKVTVLPAQSTADEVLALKPDGVFLSNGPGDPEPCDYAIKAAATLIEKGIPTFGICLGHQIMALASGAKTLKMKFGHHGANHPVKDLDNGKVYITSQNHGFAVDEKTLPSNLRITHVSLFDGSIQGLTRTDKPAFCFQGHPEASPGPHDIEYLFNRFVQLMANKE